MNSDDIFADPNATAKGAIANQGGPATEEMSAAVLPRHRVPAHLARRFHQICLGVIAEILMPEGLRPIEYALLAAVDDNPGLDQRRLAATLGIDTTSVGQMADRLALAGWLDRKLVPTDRRIRLLVPTEQGTLLRQRLRPSLLAAQGKILAPLRPEEQSTLLSLLTRVVEANDAYARPGNGRRKFKRKKDSFCA